MVGILFIAAGGGCGPRVAPEGPEPGPGPEPGLDMAEAHNQPTAPPPAREVVVGEMCPATAAGRPAVLPLFMRSLSWSDAADDTGLAVESRAARVFSVLAWSGRRVGVFSVAGVADVGLDRRAAVGAYAGTSPCATLEAAGAPAGVVPECVEAQAGCGLAVAVLERGGGSAARPFDEDPEPTAIPVGGACLAGKRLLVDIDGDGVAEAYPAAGFLDPVNAPADEVTQVSRGDATCTPSFSLRHMIPPADPRHWRGLDLLGVLDLDGDGKNELVMAYHYEDRRTWAIYSPMASVARLDLIGEAVPWPER